VTLAGPVNNYGNGRADGRLDVKVDDLFFEPTFVEADPGAGITLTVRNNGKTRHSFTVTAQGLDETIEPGEVREIEVTAPSSDFIEFRCRFHADEGMRGAVYVSAAK
jgi:plastocyanin